jgi:hypothetical protein
MIPVHAHSGDHHERALSACRFTGEADFTGVFGCGMSFSR